LKGDGVGIGAFRYDGRRVLVVGGATGMGAATANTAKELGADIVVMDVADVAYPAGQVLKVDLRDQVSVDAALEQVAGPIDAVFCCAGVADGTAGLMLINFIAQRHLIERLRDDGRLGRGAAVAMISSVAGLGWEGNLPTVLDFLAQPDWDTAAKWVDANGTDNYGFSKQAINTYVAHEAFPLLKRGIRINAILPGPTDTPLARANADVWLTFGADYREAAGIGTLAPEQMANTLAFLCSEAASGINGATILVDAGHLGAGLTGSFEAPVFKMLFGLE
jgi:NAD(P)-dependent dehydrogenase (short-subunit alcohol dehydrogenase family)